MVFYQTLTHGLFLIVFTSGQLFAGHVVFAFHLRRIEFDVVYATGCRVDATANDAVDDQFVRHVEFQHVINGNARLFHGVSLRNGPREAVQQEAVTAIFLGDTLFHQRDDQLIGHQLASVHNVFRLLTELRAGFYRRAQHIAGGDLRNTVFLHDELSLSSFTRARSAKQNNTHYENPLKSRFNFSKTLNHTTRTAMAQGRRCG